MISQIQSRSCSMLLKSRFEGAIVLNDTVIKGPAQSAIIPHHPSRQVEGRPAMTSVGAIIQYSPPQGEFYLGSLSLPHKKAVKLSHPPPAVQTRRALDSIALRKDNVVSIKYGTIPQAVYIICFIVYASVWTEVLYAILIHNKTYITQGYKC